MSVLNFAIHSNLGSKILYYKNISYYSDVIREYYSKKLKYNSVDFENILCDAENYVDTLKHGECEYSFSKSSSIPNLYSSVYACLIKAKSKSFSEKEKKEWEAYFDGFQDDLGFFVDKRNVTSKYFISDNWGAKHLIPHILIAYDRIGSIPKKEFSYLRPFYKGEYAREWINSLDWRNSWAASNKVMNIGVALLYSRDFMKIDIGNGFNEIRKWLLDNMNQKYMVWHKGPIISNASKYDCVRGAYHILPLLLYDGFHFPETKSAVKLIGQLQNKWGGFNSSIISSACDDIDAIDYIIRIEQKQDGIKEELKTILEKSIDNTLSNRNKDGGFCFSRSKHGFQYGDCPILKSNANESNIFGTWFRIVCLEEIFDFLGKKKMKGSIVPGYEYEL